MTAQKIALKADHREATGKAVADLRLAGKVPAVLYGHKIKNQNLIINQAEFEKVLNIAGESTLIDLKIDNLEPVKVLIHTLQRDPVSHKIIHLDLYQVNMHEKIKTEVELNFINESPAVKDLGGVLVKTMDSIEVECLPGNLISHLDIDLSTLKNINDIIRVKDLSTPQDVIILSNPESPVVLVEELKQIEEEPVVAAVTPEAQVAGTEQAAVTETQTSEQTEVKIKSDK